MHGREPFGYVVGVEGTSVRLNMLDAHRGQVASHREGISRVTEIGGLFGVDGGTRLLVLRVRSLSFAEPREAHKAGIGSSPTGTEPLRNLEATVMGTIHRSGQKLSFTSDALVSPALGAEAYPLTQRELACVLGTEFQTGATINLGLDTRGGGDLLCGLSQLLSRHVAILGGTGQGKSCFTAAILQQMATMKKARIVVFDINGEYADALRPHTLGSDLICTELGGPNAKFRIPYYALGRHGLGRLLMPSEKTQRPALTFALENLSRVQWFPLVRGAGVTTDTHATLFDDARPGDATPAWNAIEKIRSGAASQASTWPHMGALSALAAESHSLKRGRASGYERDGFHYSNVAPLVTRIRRCIDDALFTSVVDINGGTPAVTGKLDWEGEGRVLCDRIFGGVNTTWKIHVLDLRSVAHDLMPLVLGSMLELLAFELFRRGQNGTHPTLLVLEEAHHYLRRLGDPNDESGANSLAYERLAKEGRKFGLSLWLSTQRPSELSTTVLAQCGTWVVFRLTSEQDLKAVASAGEWVDRQELARIAGLPRRQAVVFGAGVTMPVRVLAPLAEPAPKSSDPDFEKWHA